MLVTVEQHLTQLMKKMDLPSIHHKCSPRVDHERTGHGVELMLHCLPVFRLRVWGLGFWVIWSSGFLVSGFGYRGSSPDLPFVGFRASGLNGSPCRRGLFPAPKLNCCGTLPSTVEGCVPHTQHVNLRIVLYRGTSLTSNSPPLGTYSRPMRRIRGGWWGMGIF